MRYQGELKNWACHFFHSTVDRAMRPLIISLAMYFGNDISMASIFTTLHMIDWLHWPLHSLPHFMNNIRGTKRQMRRIQMFLMVDEVQNEMVLEKESAWGKPALEVNGNFTWGLVAK